MDTNNRPLKVFLCHSANDKPNVRKLYDRLVASGIDAWLDEKKILAGKQWDIEIQKAVRESDVVLVCLSNSSLTKEGYVQKEIRLALDIALEKPEGTIYLIPTRLEECKVPNSLSTYQWIDIFNEDGYSRLEKSLYTRADSLGISIRNELPIPIKSRETDIALWGVCGSGKTWFIHALGRELSWYNERDQNFIYRLIDNHGNNVFGWRPPSTDLLPPTMGIEDRLWTFEREAKNTSRAVQLSTFKHKILVHDSPGQRITDNLKVTSDSSFLETYIFKTSRNIIAILDPTTVENSPVALGGELTYSKKDYARLMESLVDTVASNSENEKIRIAVCVSKSDLLKIKLPAEELTRVIFGDSTIHVLSSNRIEKRFFKTSSVGYAKPGVPNMDSTSGNLMDETRWHPIGVADPFFWFFESIERERISTNDFLGSKRKMYLPYPPIRNFDF